MGIIDVDLVQVFGAGLACKH